MDIELRDIDSIIPYEKNPRLNDNAVDAVAESIREFGFRQPVVVDGDSVIICGHTRWKAAKKLQLAKVPVHVATDLSPEQVKAYRIADNKTAELAEWDFDQLRIEVADLQVDVLEIGAGHWVAHFRGTVNSSRNSGRGVAPNPGAVGAATRPSLTTVRSSTRSCSNGLAPSEYSMTTAAGLAKARVAPAWNESTEPQQWGASSSW